MKKLPAYPVLRRLVIDNAAAGKEGAQLIARCPRLRDLEIHRTTMSSDDFAAAMTAVPGLERLQLKGANGLVKASDLRHLQQLPRFAYLFIPWDINPLPFENGLEHLVPIATLREARFGELTPQDDAILKLRNARPDMTIYACPYCSTPVR